METDSKYVFTDPRIFIGAPQVHHAQQHEEESCLWRKVRYQPLVLSTGTVIGHNEDLCLDAPISSG